MTYMNDEMKRMGETCLQSELIFDGRVMHLYYDRVKLPNGMEATREYARHIGAVCVLPLFADGTVACVRQFRYPHGEILTEIPAGKLDSKQEDHAEAALRELREETGAVCEKLHFLGTYIGSPAILDERIDLYFAEGLTFGDTDPDEDEFIELERIPLSTLVEEALNGRLPDGKTQLAVLKVHEILRRRGEERK